MPDPDNESTDQAHLRLGSAWAAAHQEKELDAFEEAITSDAAIASAVQESAEPPASSAAAASAVTPSTRTEVDLLLPEMRRMSQPMTYAVGTLVRVPQAGKFWEAKITRVDVDAGRASRYTVRWEYEEFAGAVFEEQVEHLKVIGKCMCTIVCV